MASSKRFTRVIERRGLRSEISAAWAISVRIWKVELSYPLSLLWFILMPFLWLIPMVLAGSSVSTGPDSAELARLTGIKDWVSYVAIGTGLMGLTLSIIWGTGMSLRREQNVGTLETLMTTPIERSTLVLGSALHNLQHGGLGVILQLVASTILFGVTLNAWGVFPALVILALGVIALQGVVYAIACVVMVAKQGWMIVEFIGDFLILLAPTAYPLAVLPWFLQAASLASPLTWTVEAFRDALILGPGAPSLVTAALVLLTLDAIYVPLGLLLYKRTETWVRKRGALSQF
ncbi:MAG: ABC transporter permease [Candidatus Thorarchaeota archaeon]